MEERPLNLEFQERNSKKDESWYFSGNKQTKIETTAEFDDEIVSLAGVTRFPL